MTHDLLGEVVEMQHKYAARHGVWPNTVHMTRDCFMQMQRDYPPDPNLFSIEPPEVLIERGAHFCGMRIQLGDALAVSASR